MVMLLQHVLFAETRVQALPGKLMLRAVRERLPQELRGKFPTVGVQAVYGGENKQPFDVLDAQLDDSVVVRLHIGLPDGTVAASQPKVDLGIVPAIREFAAKRGWILAGYRNSLSFSPQHFGFDFSLFPDRQDPMKEMPFYLYHVTDTKNVESIRREGLKPRQMMSKNRNYPGRVYLFSDTSLMRDMIQMSIDAHDAIARIGSSFYKPLTKTPDISIIKVNTNKLRRGTKFFIDPEFDGNPGAVYTYTHIPPEAIASIQPTGY